jgi:flagellar biosynthesis regulator FlbT
MALKISLKPGDRLWMGTSTVEVAGLGYATLIINGPIPVMRDSDVIENEPMSSTTRQFRYYIQQAYLAQDSELLVSADQLLSSLPQNAAEARRCLDLFRSGERFQAMRAAIVLDRENGAK